MPTRKQKLGQSKSVKKRLAAVNKVLDTLYSVDPKLPQTTRRRRAAMTCGKKKR